MRFLLSINASDLAKFLDNPEVAEAAQLHINYAGELTENWQDTDS